MMMMTMIMMMMIRGYGCGILRIGAA